MRPHSEGLRGLNQDAEAFLRDANISFQPGVVQTVAIRFQLQRTLLVGVGQSGQFRMAKQGIVLKVELGVQRQNILVFHHNERIALRQRGVLFPLQAVRQQQPAGTQHPVFHIGMPIRERPTKGIKY